MATPNVTFNGYSTALTAAADLSALTVYNPKNYGAKFDGATDDTQAWNSMYTAMTNGGIVDIPIGTSLVDPSVLTNHSFFPTANTLHIGRGWGSIIKVKSGAGAITHLFQANNNFIGFENLTIDGNHNPSQSLVLFGGYTQGQYSDCWARHCQFLNSANNGVYVNNGTQRPKILDCYFYGNYGAPIRLAGALGYALDADVLNNTLALYGFFGVACVQAEKIRIRGNRVYGTLVTGLTVNTSGTAVTLTAGSLAGIQVNQYMTISGVNYQITAIASNTSCTLGSSAGTQTGVAATAGSLEGVNLDTCSDYDVSHNQVVGTNDSGIVIHLAAGGADSRNGRIEANDCEGCAAIGISFDGSDRPASEVIRDTVVVGNTAKNNAQNGSAGASNYNAGIRLFTHVQNVVVSSNRCFDDQGVKTQVAGIALDSLDASSGNLIVDNNVNGNKTTAIRGAGAGVFIARNPGYNPVGSMASPTVGASPWTYTNATGVDQVLNVSGGTVSAISANGSSTGLTSGSFLVPSGQTLVVTYTVTPTVTASGL